MWVAWGGERGEGGRSRGVKNERRQGGLWVMRERTSGDTGAGRSCGDRQHGHVAVAVQSGAKSPGEQRIHLAGCHRQDCSDVVVPVRYAP